MLPDNCFLFSRSDVLALEQSRLFGYAITEDSLIFGTGGLAEYLRSHSQTGALRSGRFAGIFLEGDSIRVRTDTTGQELIYVHRHHTDWTISNSFLLLASEVAKHHVLSLYEPAALGFHLKDGFHIGEQLVSFRTAIREIEILPGTSELIIHRLTGEIRMEDHPFEEVFTLSSDDYHQTMIEVIERSSGALLALANAGLGFEMMLSGGYDSRLVLALLLAGGRPDSLRVKSHLTKANDFAAAQSICRRLGLPLNTEGPERRCLLSTSDSFRVWLLSCGGTYLPIYPVSNARLSRDAEIRLTGDQPTGWSHFAGKGAFNGSADSIGKDIANALKDRDLGAEVRDDFLGVFDRMGIARDHPAAMLAYYSAVRSRHHCGRNWYKSLGTEYLFTPLMMGEMIAIDLKIAAQGLPPTQFFVDMFSAFGGWVLSEPFETPERSFGDDSLLRSRFKGGLSIQPRPMEMYGSPLDHDQERDAPDLFSVPVEVRSRPAEFKGMMEHLLYRAGRAKQSRIFQERDFAKAHAEFQAADSSLSHGYRKSTHILTTDIILRIVEDSRQSKVPGTSSKGHHPAVYGSIQPGE